MTIEGEVGAMRSPGAISTSGSGSEGQPSPEPPAATMRAASAATSKSPPVPLMSSVGRIKAPPSCKASLQREAFSSNDLSKICFSADEAVAVAAVGEGANGCPTGRSAHNAAIAAAAAVPSSTGESEQTTSSSSSLASSHEHGGHPELHVAAAAAAGSGGRGRGSQSALPTPVHQQTVSRTGRETQRWATDPTTGQLIRLTTGCVPIMRDGRILLCSSSRKEAWILPKGGWESDETLAESAIRETYEEAGVTGTLGPVLSDVEYETRKAKKRRLERESLIKTMREEQKRGAVTCTSEDEHHSSPQQQLPKPQPQQVQPIDTSDVTTNGQPPIVAAVPAGTETKSNNGSMSPPVSGASSATTSNPVIRIPQFQSNGGGSAGSQHHDDAASVASVASMSSDVSTSCTHARLKLFPLYVSEVHERWPESGRARKVLDIDAAIAMMESRPEFRTALVEVKERGLHLVGPGMDASMAGETTDNGI